MTGHNDRYSDIEVDVLDEADVRAVIDNALRPSRMHLGGTPGTGQGWKLFQRDRSAGLVRRLVL